MRTFFLDIEQEDQFVREALASPGGRPYFHIYPPGCGSGFDAQMAEWKKMLARFNTRKATVATEEKPLGGG